MARNLREGSQGQINVTASGAVVAGTVYTDAGTGMTGIAVTDAADGEVFALDCRPNVHYLFRKDGSATVGELGPAIPDATWPLTAGEIQSPASSGSSVPAVLLEDGDAASAVSVYNTPAGHILVIVNPTSA